MRVFLPLFVGILILSLATGAPAAATTLQWPNDTELRLSSESRVELDREQRRIELHAGVLEVVAAGGAPVRVITERLTISVHEGRVWIRAADEGTSLWLQSGRARIEHATSEAVELDLPMTYVEAQGRTAPTPPLPVSRARAAVWSALISGEVVDKRPPTGGSQEVKAVASVAPTGSNGESWAIQVASLAERAQAEGLQARLRAAGVIAEVAPTRVDSQTRYRVRVNGFSSRALARDFAAAHRDILGTDAPWITCTGRCAP